MPLWYLSNGDIGLGVASCVGVGIASSYFVRKAIRKKKKKKESKVSLAVKNTPTKTVPKSIPKKEKSTESLTGENGSSVDIVSGLASIKIEAESDGLQEPKIKKGDAGKTCPKSAIMAECFNNAGDKMLKEQSFAEAMAAYTDGIDICPSSDRFLKARLYCNRAAVYEKLGAYNKVISDCNQSLAEYNGDEEVYERRAAAHMYLGQHKQALGDYATIAYLCRFPQEFVLNKIEELTHKFAREKTNMLYMRHNHPPPPKYAVDKFLDRYYNHPLKMVEGASIHSSVLSISQAGPNGGPLSEEDKILINAHNEFLAGNIMTAYHLEDKDIKVSSNPELYMLLRATARQINGSSDSALGLLLQIAVREDMDPLLASTILIQTASLLTYIGLTAKSEGCFNQAAAITPDNTDIYFHKGEVYFKSGDYLRAIENYAKAIKCHPRNTQALIAKALALYKQANKSDAPFVLKYEGDGIFRELLESHDQNYLVHLEYAKIQTNRRNFAEAEEQFDQAHYLAPTMGEVLTEKADMYLMMDRQMKALESLEKALYVDPQCVKAYEQIGLIQAERNIVAASIKMFNTGLQYAMNSTEFFNMYVMYFTAQSKIDVGKNLGLPICLDEPDSKHFPP